MIASGVSEGLNPSKINILRTDYSNRLYHVLIDSPTEDIGRLHRISASRVQEEQHWHQASHIQQGTAASF